MADAMSLVGKAYTAASQRSVDTAMRAFFAFQRHVAPQRPVLLMTPKYAGDLEASLHNEFSLMLFATFCWKGGLAPSSTATYTSLVKNNLGVKFGWKLTCAESETRLPRLLKGLKRTETRVRRKRVGLRAHHHRQLVHNAPPSNPRETTHHAMLATARQGLARGADMLPQRAADFDPKHDCTIGDLSFPATPEEQLQLMLEPAKKAPGQAGKVPVLIPKSDSPSSAYALVRAMLADRRAHARAHGRELGADEPLFADTSGPCPIALTVADLRSTTKAAAIALGLNPDHFGAHSSRIGGATDHFAANTPPIIIQVCGRWDSDIWAIYARQCPAQILNCARMAENNADLDLEQLRPDFTQPAITHRR